jgi:preprotein translocase subunit SecG
MGMFVLVIMLIVYVISCLFLILVILGQEGKGGGLSGLVGSTALGDTLGASAAESTLRRWTRNIAVIFIVLSLSLTIVGSRVIKSSILDGADDVPPPGQMAPSPEEFEPLTTPTATTPTGGPTGDVESPPAGAAGGIPTAPVSPGP